MSLEQIRERIEGLTGITLERGARSEFLESLVRERMLALGIQDLDQYTRQCLDPALNEVERLINGVTVTYTWFYRDADQVEALGELLRRSYPGKEPVRIWVAACATGEEAYTVAMLAAAQGRPVEVLATDINSDALDHAKRGRYGRWALRDLPQEWQRTYLDIVEKAFVVRPEVRASVVFQRHNLKDPPLRPDGSSGWDIIICRNVLIYFPHAVVMRTLQALGESLAPRGTLILGAGEVVVEVPPGLMLVPFASGKALRPGVSPSVRPPVPPPRATPTLQISTGAAGKAPAGNRGKLVEAAACLQAGRFDEAVAVLTRVLAEDPLHARAQMLLGIVLYRAGEIQAALRALRGALVINPSLWPAVFYMALAYGDLGHAETARNTYLWLLDLLDKPASCTPDDGELFEDLEAWRGEVRMLSKLRSRRVKSQHH